MDHLFSWKRPLLGVLSDFSSRLLSRRGCFCLSSPRLPNENSLLSMSPPVYIMSDTRHFTHVPFLLPHHYQPQIQKNRHRNRPTGLIMLFELIFYRFRVSQSSGQWDPQTVSQKKLVKKRIAIRRKKASLQGSRITVTLVKEELRGNGRKVNVAFVRQGTTACTETSQAESMHVCVCVRACLRSWNLYTCPLFSPLRFSVVSISCTMPGQWKRCQKEAGPYADIVHCVRQMPHLGVSTPTNLHN